MNRVDPSQTQVARTRPRKTPRTRIDITLPIERQPFYLTVADVAAIFGKSTRTIAMWEQKGLLRVTRPAGGAPLIARTEVERLLVEGGAGGER